MFIHGAFRSRGEYRLLLFDRTKRSTVECGENSTTYGTRNTDKQSQRTRGVFAGADAGVRNKTRASQDSDPVFVWDG